MARTLRPAAALFAAVAVLTPLSGASNAPLDPAVDLDEAPVDAADAAAAPVVCSAELDAYCPPLTTCCPRRRRRSRQTDGVDATAALEDGAEGDIVGYSCLLSWSSRIPQGPCCDEYIDDTDDADLSASIDGLGSGCAAGYVCAAPIDTAEEPSFLKGDDLASRPHCVRDETAHPIDRRGRPIENEYETMPRYRTCPAFKAEEISAPYGLPVPVSAADYDKGGDAGLNIDMDGAGAGEATKDGDASDHTDEGGNKFVGQLAYFSNQGSLAAPSAPQGGITTAVVGIHGSGRDAASYLCAMVAAVAEGASSSSGMKGQVAASSRMQGQVEEQMVDMMEGMNKRLDLGSPETSTLRRRAQDGDTREDGTSAKASTDTDDILVIAPWFLAPADGTPASSSSLPFLKWADEAPIAHTFRYGAESIPNDTSDTDGEKNGKATSSSATVSSYGAMDVLFETLCDKRKYPNLEKIVVAGHSAGGQFVHRWALASDSWCFGDSGKDVPEGVDGKTLPSVRAVAANPRSYAYLDGRRYFPTTADERMALEDGGGDETGTLSPFDELEFRPPTTSERDDCEEYNQYCWGLEDNPDVPAPYITSNIDKLSAKEGDAGDNSDLFRRYAARDVVYLSGQRDTKHLGNQICHEDGYQGPSRRERSERFYASLQVRGKEVDDARANDDGNVPVHSRIVVKNVGHDHALIFQSVEGREGLFSDP